LIKNGDIYSIIKNKETRLTNTGLNKSPIIHPNGEWIYYVKVTGAVDDGEVHPPKDYKGDYALKEEIWKIDTTGERNTLVYKSALPPEPNQAYYTLFSVDNIQFSPDGKKVYFETNKWVTSNAVYVMDSDGSKAKILGPGNGLKIIKSNNFIKNEYIGYLVVSQLRHFKFGGSYYWNWLFDPDFKEIGPIGDNLPDDLSFINQTIWNPIVTMKSNRIGKSMNQSFENYRAQRYRGKIHLPKWISHDDENEWRDDLGKVVSEPKINFAGKYFMATHSCGTSCSYHTLTDLSTGQDLDLLKRFNNGEDQIVNEEEIHSYHTDLFVQPDSNMIIARKCGLSWEGEEVNCQESVFLFKNEKLNLTTTRDVVIERPDGISPTSIPSSAHEPIISPRQIEIIQTVLNPDGYISKELHSEFWGLMPVEMKNNEQARSFINNFIKKGFVIGIQFNKEAWASMKASIEAGRVVKTPGYDLAKEKFYTSVPPQARSKIQKSIDNAEGMITAAAEAKPFQLNRGTIYITLEMVNQVLTGFDDSSSRASRLMSPEWGQKLKEYHSDVLQEKKDALPVQERIKQVEMSIQEIYNQGAARQKAIDKHNQMLEDYDTSFLGSVWGYWRFNTGFGTVAESVLDAALSGPKDPDFNMTDSLKETVKILPGLKNTEYAYLTKAYNKTHFNMLMENLSDKRAFTLNNEALGELISIAAGLFASVVNPMNYVLFFFILSLTKRKPLSITMLILWIVFATSWKVYQ